MTTDETPTPERPRPPLTTTVSLRPAMTVLILAVVTLGTFVAIDLATSQTVTTPTTIELVGGLAVAHTSTALADCEVPGIIPGNVLSAYIVPVQTVSAGPPNNATSDPDAYDCSQEVTAPYPQSEVLGFYASEFRTLGWNEFSSGPAIHGGGQQELFDIAGSDTFEWVSGVTVNATSAHSTSWTLRFYQDDAID